jgi:hypothetical protein
VDHIADKICANFESHGESARPSTDYLPAALVVPDVVLWESGYAAEDTARCSRSREHWRRH